MLQLIEYEGKLLALIVPREMAPEKTTFLTDDKLNFQAGFVVYPKDSEIPRHAHHPIQRQVVGTSEVLLVKSGRCEADIYNDAKELVATHTLHAGDIIILYGGGHGFRVIEDCVLFEIKQGPYGGLEEKYRF